VAKRRQFARPMVGRTAGFHSDAATRQFREERQQFRPDDTLADNDRTGGIDTVDLEDVLGQIKANGSNLRHGRLLLCVAFNDDHGNSTSMPEAGAVHPIISASIAGTA
jgi:hypothetical protein